MCGDAKLKQTYADSIRLGKARRVLCSGAVGAYGGAMAYPQMGSFGQPPGTFPGREGPPGLAYGWVWGLAPPGGGGMVPPPGHPSQLPPGESTPSATPPGQPHSGHHNAL